MGNFKSKISYYIRKLETHYYKLILDKKRPLIIITGCGRSGTTFSSKVLRQMGLEIGHERLKKNGISSWYMVSQKKKVELGPSLYDLEKFEKIIIHQVREPLPAISSMLSTGSPSWRFLSYEIPIDIENDSKILKAMKYYFYWNKQTENITNIRIKAEEFTLSIEKILKEHNLNYNSGTVNIDKKTKVNTRKHNQLSWQDLTKEDEILAEKIKKLGEEYGYS